MQRRLLLRTAAALGTGGLAVAAGRSRRAEAARPAAALRLRLAQGPGARAGRPALPARRRDRLPPSIAALDWDQYQSIRFRTTTRCGPTTKLRFQVEFFHLGLFFKRPVQHVRGGRRPGAGAGLRPGDVRLRQERPDGAPAAGRPRLRRLPPELPHATRARRRRVPRRELLPRGRRRRGSTACRRAAWRSTPAWPRPEEFPTFTRFWLERPAPDSNTLVVYALLDSPSVAGAYRFAITPGDTHVMDVDAALYPRKAIERLGIAPLHQHVPVRRERPPHGATTGAPRSTTPTAWRCGPAAASGSGARSPTRRTLRFNAFADKNPRGFGLLQRDRDFDHYQDDGVFYDRRPSLWVEPKGDWGEGSVQLVEIPTVDETFDNIVAFWNPAAKPQPGQELLFSYRLYWGAQPPAQSPLRACVATRTGIGGVVGKKRTLLLVALRGRLRRRRPRRCSTADARSKPVITRHARQDRDHLGAPARRDQRLARDVRPRARGQQHGADQRCACSCAPTASR